MSGEDLVRAWKDPDERGDIPHPAGEISLDALNGGGVVGMMPDFPRETVLGGNTCFWCVPEPLPFRAVS
jgi:hypothetical protein